MPDLRDTSADVSGLRAVNEAPEQPQVTDRLHRSRAREYLVGQVFGISAAMGAVWLGHRAAPQQMKAASQLIEKLIKPHMSQQSEQFIAEEAHRLADYSLMFAGGLASSLSAQTILSRRRRAGLEHADEISLQRDVGRLLTGWGVGSFGAAASAFLADRYLRRGSSKALTDSLTRAEEMLDQYLLGGASLLPKSQQQMGSKVSEVLVENLTMLPGGAAASLVGQKLYDSLVKHPAYERG